jgi:hypothetical protein
MNNFDIDIQIVDGRRAVAETSVDYIPFGVSTLKLQIRKIAGPAQKVWIRTKHFKRDQDPCAIYGHADDGEDLWVVWGAGDIMGFCTKYAEQAGTKKAVVLDDDKPHTVYLNLIHRPRDPIHHQLRDRQLTIVAVCTDAPDSVAQQPCTERQYQDRIIAEKTFTLTVPKGASIPIRPVWEGQPDASHITFQGDDVPRYTSRWWQTRQVAYAPVKDTPRITLDFVRVANNEHEGEITVWLEKGDRRECLAVVAGHLTRPIYDLRWFVPGLYRFHDDKLFVLRLSFFWTNEHLDGDALLAFVPDAQKEALRDQRTREAAELMQSSLRNVWLGWDKQYEIPDMERFDIVFDPNDLTTKYGCTDAHWKEFWFKVDGSQPCQCRIAAPKDAINVVLEYLAKYFKFTGEEEPEPITNPLEEGRLAKLITSGRCIYDKRAQRIVFVGEKDGQAKAPGFLGKNAPRVENSRLLKNGLSSDVLEG